MQPNTMCLLRFCNEWRRVQVSKALLYWGMLGLALLKVKKVRQNRVIIYAFILRGVGTYLQSSKCTPLLPMAQ
jgi:hypothetical protein